MAEQGDRQQITIANRSDGGVVFWLIKLYAMTTLILVEAAAVACVAVYAYFAGQTPPTPDLASYIRVAPGVTRIYAADGTTLGEFAEEWREIVPYDEIPVLLVQAVLAAEDHTFFEHRGIYFKGIARALWRNLGAGDFAQGGSTITQQVAKQFLGNEKSLTRKAKEAILARRLERSYSKEAILSVYLNQIFLGNRAYGVRAAAMRYFSKDLDELDLGEMATIAGLAQAPSRYSPTQFPQRAARRRDEILEKMERFGYLKPGEADSFRGKPIEVRPHPDLFGDVSPYFAEHIRRYVVDNPRYGSEALLRGGLRIETTVEPVVDGAAAENVDFGARKQDKRQGWRGPEAYLEGKARDVFLERSRALYGSAAPAVGHRYLGLVEEVNGARALVNIAGASYELPIANLRWAAKWSARDYANDREIGAVTQALKEGDVIWVAVEPPLRGKFRDWFLAEGVNPRWSPPRTAEDNRRAGDAVRLTLEQVPHPQAALFTADHQTGYVLAMAGGADYTRSEYNRVTQACRQPGSTYKPIYYSAALEDGYGYDTQLNDIPRAEVDPITGQVWTPTNLHGTIDTTVTLEYAMVFSKNIPSVAIFKKVGAPQVEAWARRLGFTTKIIADQALALGASCTLLDELTRAFAIFARNGRWIDWVYVRRVRDRNGVLLEDNTVYGDPLLAAGDRLDRLAATAGARAREAIPARSAYLTSRLLRHTIEHGFATVVRNTDIIAAGKTGTSSATMDTSFVAYTSRWITAHWLGDDMRERPLGKDDAAYMTVVPLWARYMYEVTQDQPNREIPWEVPEGVNPKDRGGRKNAGSPMPLVYQKHEKPNEG